MATSPPRSPDRDEHKDQLTKEAWFHKQIDEPKADNLLVNKKKK